ncbi:MAG: glycosyltransferase family 39 protein [Anaerolineales bacterium]|nr:glycosyltransferase family 39 protein [Anaerolineales bacterium]
MKYRSLLLALLIAAVLKAVLIWADVVTFNGDEAVIALMARHINRLGTRPVFFYGQAYMGSLDGYMVAAAFRIFGEKVFAIRIVHGILYLLFLWTGWLLARRLFKHSRIADIAVLLAAIPPVVMSTYTTATLGGYTQSLVLGNIILLLGYEVTFGEKENTWWAWLALGAVSGLAFWVLGISGVYILPVGLVGLLHFKFKRLPFYALAALGFFLGGILWWNYNFTHDWAALQTLGGPEMVATTPFDRLLGLLFLGIPAVLGLRAPWALDYFPLPLIFVILIFYLAVALFVIVKLREARRNSEIKAGMAPGTITFLGVLVGAFVVVFVGSNFGLDSTGRYLLPLYLPFTYATATFVHAAWKRKRSWGIGLLVLVMALNAAGTWLGAISTDKLTTQFDPITSFDNSYDDALMDFLNERGISRGYSNYWVTFRLAFLSDEQLIFSPELPYKDDLSYTDNDNRYPRYAQMADDSDEVAYITTKHPQLDAVIRTRFEELGVTYLEHEIGPFHIFYELSRPVRPEEIGYGAAAP